MMTQSEILRLEAMLRERQRERLPQKKPNTQTALRAEISELKAQLHQSIRAKTAAMSPSELAVYRAGLRPEHRALHDKITGTAPTARAASAPRVRPSADFAALDAQWNLGPKPAACTRSPGQVAFSAAGVSTPARQPVQPTAARAPAQSSRSLHPRVSAAGRATAHSPDADALDRAMGFEPEQTREQRHYTTRTYSVFD